MTQTLLDSITAIAGDRLIRNEPMSKHTTFRVGGAADYYVSASGKEEAVSIIRLLYNSREPFFIIGNGSNILVSDAGFRGTIVELSTGFSDISVDGDVITAQSGILLSRLSAAALKYSLTGLEFASGIPGTLGGAIYMNAGAYGGEMKDIVESVTLYDIEADSTFTYSCSEMKFSYRHSIVKERKLLVLSASLKLSKGNPDEIRAKMDELKEKRISKQPLEYPSAGSTFKRPEGYFAGRLIEDAGLKGYTVGGAQVSEKHCGFVINKGSASADDIITLIGDVRNKVYENSGVMLEPEVIIL